MFGLYKVVFYLDHGNKRFACYCFRRFTMSQFLSYLLILSFFFFFFINSLGTNSSPLLEICPLHLCGDVDISYPFWVLKESASDQQQYCGYPGFGVMCLNGTAELELHGDRYHVKDINYADYTLSLVDIDVSNQTCPRARHNVSLETLPLKYSSMDLNLSYYFNCISYPPTVPFIPCLNISSNRSYVFVENHETVGFDWSKNCEQKVVVTVRQTQINMNNLTGGFGVAMNDGFLLDWQRVKDCGTCESSERYWETVKDCATCEKSEGYCGYNATAEEFLCFCNDGIAHGNSCKDKRGSKWFKYALGVIFFIHQRRMKKKYDPSTLLSRSISYDPCGTTGLEAFVRNYGPLSLNRYKFSDVKKFTNSFKVKLGQGGYGGVYKGELLNGRLVAVKVLNASKGNGDEFINEVASISRTSHVNIVTLLGFCLEGKKRALIYEFMPNGSLEKFIHSDNTKTTTMPLGLEKLFQIAIGIARGLEYLHRGCNTRILHFDIKPHNILLDENFSPKISDFGLAKISPRNESNISMAVARGTIGYIAPEVFSRNFGVVSHKSDVYSYGMMILEMVGGKKDIDVGISDTSEIYFPHWIYKRLEQYNDLGFPINMTIEETAMVRKMILVGLWCIQTNPSDRPSMSKVIEMLEGNIEALQIPPKPFLSSPPRSPIEESSTY
ncbi:LEAF RUST 10 DISEASE-RESISTANCE LOCUS RECEPTOR-LIKE PROTEIN KINASE-like 2.1 isoform X2 [Quercus suber]|uniref:LEAF RUST 10 DISEASE-RESISTANCE LOCUS RECEPTOR-LIKE PROTEIN KINASE-like 2.1 isoform X2 n=1 Tax=Quercus suber TaxID=58331 RepID=UPI0032E0170D